MRSLVLSLVAAIAVLIAVLPAMAPAAHAAGPAEQAGCVFTLGFKALRDQIPQVVGQCLENERVNPANGNTEQRTTGGLLVWRAADNWTAFTNGATTWLNGPFGLQSRANAGPLFPWETGAVAGGGSPAAAPPSAAAPMATIEASGWATVTAVVSPAALAVRNDAGQQFYVHHIGIIGPTEGQGEWNVRARSDHASRLPGGTRVWLQAEEGLGSPAEGWALRHVLREGAPDRPIAAELLRSGGVWVFPHSHHDFVPLYANLQAEAVVTRTGAWGETPSSAVFRPRGISGGGYPINPAVVPALTALDRTEIGHAVLVKVNDFPVEIGVSDYCRGAVACFNPRYYSIQLSDDIMSAAPESIAAVLIHEITHARQMADREIEAKDIGCYGGEVEAFNIAAQFWGAVYGPNGKSRETHWLDRELNMTLRQYGSQQIEQRVKETYGHQCG
jgi:hypothetical protein